MWIGNWTNNNGWIRIELDTTEHYMHAVVGDEWLPVAGFISMSSGVVGRMSGDYARW